MALLAISAVRILSCKTVTDNGRRFHYESLRSLRVTFLDCVSVTSWALVYAVISFEVHSLVLGVGIFSVNVFTSFWLISSHHQDITDTNLNSIDMEYFHTYEKLDCHFLS